MTKAQLKIYDTATRKKRLFKSLNEGQVKMYCCGPTVYDYLHIGNFRGAIFFNFVRNWLEFLNYKVNYIYNFTDIDDKILNRALKENTDPQKLSQKYIEEFKKDYQTLKLRPHTANPQATQTLKEIIQLIEKLIEANTAYEVEGDVFYSIASFKDYGCLSGRKTDEMLAGTRIEVDKRKKNPLDFALWKKSKQGETWFFDSPWGSGRPGWHIECTAMIHKFLGEEIDIHGGGSDLIFPHHENEIAQALAVSSKKYVEFWMHNNMIVTKGDKMSKSVGNMISMREFLNQYPGELFKFLILSAHYRSPLQFSKKTLEQAMVSLSKLYFSLVVAKSFLQKELALNPQSQFVSQNSQDISQQEILLDSQKTPQENLSKHTLTKPHSFQQEIKKAEVEIIEAFNDDFATPRAFAIFFSLYHGFQKVKEDRKLSRLAKVTLSQEYLSFFKKYGSLLSLFQEDPQLFLNELEDKLLEQKNISREEIDSLVKQRSLARQNKDFKTADNLRKTLDELDIEVKDSPAGSRWSLKK